MWFLIAFPRRRTRVARESEEQGKRERERERERENERGGRKGRPMEWNSAIS